MILYPFIYLHLYLYRLCRCRCRCLRPLSLPLPHFLLDGRLPIVNPISKARNATTLLQASAAATAARDKFQCDRLSRYCDRLSRYCDHWKKVDHKRRPAVVVETMFGRRLSGAPTCRDCGHLWGEGHSEPRLQLHSEPRLRLMIRQRSHACCRIAATPQRAATAACTCGRCPFRQTSKPL